MKRIFKSIISLFIAFLCAAAFIGLFAMTYLQESYRLCPPSEAERAQSPGLINFLIGE